jgi:hypothetical protein
MTDKDNKAAEPGQTMADVLKGWVMVALTLIFVLLYTTALFGWLKPLEDVTMITRLEPIIFVIIGYYFGRLPAQQNEKTLKDEINRQTQKADAAQNAKEQAKQDREALEEKVKNARVILTTSNGSQTRSLGIESAANGHEALSHAVNSAVRILNF